MIVSDVPVKCSAGYFRGEKVGGNFCESLTICGLDAASLPSPIKTILYDDASEQ